eukprot:3816553-Amphidinium_carterae.1
MKGILANLISYAAICPKHHSGVRHMLELLLKRLSLAGALRLIAGISSRCASCAVTEQSGSSIAVASTPISSRVSVEASNQLLSREGICAMW